MFFFCFVLLILVNSTLFSLTFYYLESVKKVKDHFITRELYKIDPELYVDLSFFLDSILANIFQTLCHPLGFTVNVNIIFAYFVKVVR